MATGRAPERIQTVVIGGGQAGLSVGYHLARRGLPFVILDANGRIGDSWRKRWDSLRLFTPACYDGLTGLPFPASGAAFPTKDEMADYLEAYAARFELPVRTGVRVDHLSRQADRFLVEAGDLRFEAENVVVAMASFQQPLVPPFASELDPDIVQLHSSEYRNPSQLQAGGVLVVGAGNSGAEIAREAAPDHPVWLSGRDTGQVPFRIDSAAARFLLIHLVLGLLFHHVLTIKTPMGRKLRSKAHAHGWPLVRTRSEDLVAAGVERVPKITGVQNGLPLLEDGRVLDVASVVWCTGLQPGFSWIDLPVFGEAGPIHQRGVVAAEPGLYFVGLPFVYAVSSAMIQGVGRDAAYVVKAIAARARAAQRAEEPRPVLQPAGPTRS